MMVPAKGLEPSTFALRVRCASIAPRRLYGGPPGDRTQQERFKRPPHAPANARGPFGMVRSVRVELTDIRV